MSIWVVWSISWPLWVLLQWPYRRRRWGYWNISKRRSPSWSTHISCQGNKLNISWQTLRRLLTNMFYLLQDWQWQPELPEQDHQYCLHDGGFQQGGQNIQWGITKELRWCWCGAGLYWVRGILSKQIKISNTILFLFIYLIFLQKEIEDYFCGTVKNFNSTDDREASEKSHGASNSW